MAFQVKVTVNPDKKVGPWRQIYRFFGTDEINYVYMKDGQKLLSKLGALGGHGHQVYFRAHSQFCTGMGDSALKWGSTNAYTEDVDGKPVYNWDIIDRVYDTYLAKNVKPYVQFAFMPKALSTKPDPYQHAWTPTAPYDDIYTGWTYPPKDYAKWGELCYEWTQHCVERYGKSQCESWWWETWNEPDIGYWNGTPEEFHKLHDHTAHAVKRALPSAMIGGPETTGGGPGYLKRFLQHCADGTNAATGGKGTPLDFVSFHAKGKPVHIKHPDHVRMDISWQLREIDASLGVITSFPQYKDKPIVIGESDPEGAAAAQGPELNYRNGTLYSSYTATSFARKHLLADKHLADLRGALTWAFEFEDQPYFAGFRVLASNDVDLPVLNIFRMFAFMDGNRVQSQSSHQLPLDTILKDGVRGEADVGAIASKHAEQTCVFVWHYHDDDVSGPAAAVELEVQGVLDLAKITHYRVDEHHSNSYARWLKMGSPQTPSPAQYRELQQAGSLAVYTGETLIEQKGDHSTLKFTLPRQGVSLLVI